MVTFSALQVSQEYKVNLALVGERDLHMQIMMRCDELSVAFQSQPSRCMHMLAAIPQG